VRRLAASLGSLIFLVVAPGTVAALIPWWISRWSFGPPLFGFLPMRGLGLVLIAAGVFVLLDSFIRFALQGLGTPAPIAPPGRLVVSGLYRHVRNPMYVAVLALIFGQAFFFGDVSLVVYGAFVWACFHVFVLTYEEPTLRAKFGVEYEELCEQVPRWLPRVRGWRRP
jgi:protein-S-isoprenylcysteine O-methyltransferase Ste14